MGLAAKCEIDSIGFDKFKSFLTIAPAYIEMSECVLNNNQKGELLSLFDIANKTLNSNIWTNVLGGQSPEEFYYNIVSLSDQDSTLKDFYDDATIGYSSFANLTGNQQIGLGAIVFFVIITFGAQKLQSSVGLQTFQNKVLKFILSRKINNQIVGPLNIQRYRAIITALAKFRIIGFSTTLNNNNVVIITQPTLLENGGLIPIIPACTNPCADDMEATGLNTSLMFGKEIIADYFGTWVKEGVYITKTTNCEDFCITLKNVTDYNFENRIISALMGQRGTFRYNAGNLESLNIDQDYSDYSCSSSSSSSSEEEEIEYKVERAQRDFAFYGPRPAMKNTPQVNNCGPQQPQVVNVSWGNRKGTDFEIEEEDVNCNNINLCDDTHFVNVNDVEVNYCEDYGYNPYKGSKNNEFSESKGNKNNEFNDSKGRKHKKKSKRRGKWVETDGVRAGYVPGCGRSGSALKVGTVFGYLRQILFEIYKLKLNIKKLKYNYRTRGSSRTKVCDEATMVQNHRFRQNIGAFM